MEQDVAPQIDELNKADAEHIQPNKIFLDEGFQTLHRGGTNGQLPRPFAGREKGNQALVAAYESGVTIQGDSNSSSQIKSRKRPKSFHFFQIRAKINKKPPDNNVKRLISAECP